VKAHALLVVVAMAGCDRWSEPSAAWSASVTVPARGSGFVAQLGADGDALVAGFDDQDVAYLRRLGAGGVLARDEAASPGSVNVAAIGVDDAERPIVVWGDATTATITAYDADLHARWSVPAPDRHVVAFDVGPDGSSVHVTFSAIGLVEAQLLDPEGAEVWALSGIRYTMGARVLADGDVILFDYDHVERRAAADGAILSTIAGTGFTAVDRDGHAIAIQPGELTAFDEAGAIRWHAAYEGVGGLCPYGGCLPTSEVPYRNVVLLDGGDVLALATQTGVARFAATDGHLIGEQDHCRALSLLDADAGGYLIIGDGCDGGTLLARHAAPE
jgi:hypothetical protein